MSNNHKHSDKEIIVFMKEMLEINLSYEEFANPKKELMLTIYSRFLAEFGFENMTKPDINAIYGIKNMKSYENIIAILNVFRCTAYIVSAAGIADMSLNDLIFPNRRRTKRILSVLCIVLVKLSKLQHKWCQLERKGFDMTTKCTPIQQNITYLKRLIEEKSNHLSINDCNTASKEQKLNELALIYEQKIKLGEDLKEKNRYLKSNVIRVKTEINKTNVEIIKLEDEMKHLKERLVSSPQRLLLETKEREQELKRKCIHKKRVEKQQMQLLGSLDLLTNTSKAVKPSLKILIDALKETEKIRSECQIFNETKLHISNKVKKLKELKVIFKERERSVQMLRKRILIDRKQHEKQIQNIQQINNCMKSELAVKARDKRYLEINRFAERLQLEKRLEYIEFEYKKFRLKSELYYKKHFDCMTKVKTLINDRLAEYKNVRVYT